MHSPHAHHAMKTCNLIGIMGDSTMAAGIAQVAALAGFTVKLSGTTPEITAKNLGFARQMIQRQVEKGNIPSDKAHGAMESMHPAGDIRQLRSCGLVIESMLGDRADTQSHLEQLEKILDEECVIALNTSSLPVTILAERALHPERVVGMHFFDPVPLMRTVEVIRGLRTDDKAFELAMALVEQVGHTPIAVADSPGFLVNLIGRALLTEGLRLSQEHIATPQAIDTILRASLGLRMGPFELLDLIGLDISGATIEQIYASFQYEPRLRPTPELSLRKAAGLLGRKTGQGFYPCATQGDAFHRPSPDAKLPAVWLDPSNDVLRDCVHRHLASASVLFDSGTRPLPSSLCIVMPLGEDASTCTTRRGLDPQRSIAVDACFPLEKHVTLMGAPVISPAYRSAAISLFSMAGPVSWIEDSPGFIAQRMLAVIVNMACEAAQQSIASPEDIDRAVRLALGYPQGPLTMGDRFGASRITAILSNIYETYADPRYRISPWLRRRTQLNASLLTSPHTT